MSKKNAGINYTDFDVVPDLANCKHPVAVCGVFSLVLSSEILATWSTGFEKWTQYEP